MSTVATGHIFNVPEAQGREAVEFETTAAEAQIEAPTPEIAHEVQQNAEHVHDVAQDAADAAKDKGHAFTGTPPSASDRLQQQASVATNAAVTEGQHDVNSIKTAGADYIEQAKEIVEHALSTAQSYLPDSVGGQAGTTQEAFEKAKGAVQGAIRPAGTVPPESSAPASTTTSLESGPHTADAHIQQ